MKSSKHMAPYLVAAFCGLIMIDSCNEEEKPIIPRISFAEGFQAVTEGEEATIRIIFDSPAPRAATVGLQIETDAIYGQHYQTTPVINPTGQTFLNFSEGQLAIGLNLTTTDNSRYDGTQFIVFRITFSSDGFVFGETTTHTLAIYDDEGPSTAFFEAPKSQLNEEDAQGKTVVVRLSSPAPGEGSVSVKLDPGQAVQGTHFTLDQELTNNEFSLNFVRGDTAVSFKVLPVDDAVFGGNFVLEFSLFEVSGAVKKDNNDVHAVTLVDDELPTIVQFAQASGTINEGSTTSHVVDLLLSSPVKGEGKITISFSPDTAAYGVNFTTAPAAIGNLVVLELTHDQTAASFSVTVIDDEILTGNLTIPFVIDDGTGPIWQGAHDQQYELKIIDDEEPSVVGFAAPSLTIDESQTNAANVEILLSAPALQNGTVVIDVGGPSERYVSDPPVEVMYDSWSEYYYIISLDVPKGAESIAFNLTPVDNQDCNGDAQWNFSISSVEGPLAIGADDDFKLIIPEDEPHISATLVDTEDLLREDDATGKEIVLNFSQPATTDGSITVYLDYYTNLYGRFTTVPDFITGSSSGYPYGYLDFSANATGVSFRVLPKNDDENRGDFTESFYFSRTYDSPECVLVEDPLYKLFFVDDDE